MECVLSRAEEPFFPKIRNISFFQPFDLRWPAEPGSDRFVATYIDSQVRDQQTRLVTWFFPNLSGKWDHSQDGLAVYTVLSKDSVHTATAADIFPR